MMTKQKSPYFKNMMSRKSSKKTVAKRMQEDIIIATDTADFNNNNNNKRMLGTTLCQYLQATSNILEEYSLSKQPQE